MRKRSQLLSKVVGFYQSLLRNCLEHFFPDGVLESVSDRVFIRLEDATRRRTVCVPEEDGMAVNIQWFRSGYRFRPGVPAPFLPAEMRLVETVVRILDERYEALFDAEAVERGEVMRYRIEDLVVSRFVDPTGGERISAALEALRVSGLSTYENRRLSTGVLLLGTPSDPAAPARPKPPGAPRFGVRLATVKSFHRLCDGLNTLFLVDRDGDLVDAIDVARWAEQVQGPDPIPDAMPCPKPYRAHALATRSGGHIGLALTPHQEIKIFANGTMAFAFSDARWRLLDIPTKYQVWDQAVGATASPADLALRVFCAALNLSENRHGALFVLLRDSAASLGQLVAPSDQLTIASAAEEDPEDPENASLRRVKHALRNLVRGRTVADLDPTVLESLARVDGAVVLDLHGRMLAYGSILRIAAAAEGSARAVEGSRTAAAIAASFHGPTLKVSEDGFLTMFLGGRRIWEI